jgi:hypothetical protein
MGMPEDYLRIRCGIIIHSRGEFQSRDFLERVNDYTDYFSRLLSLKDDIDKFIGKTGWAIYFVQVNPLNNYLFCDVYVDDPTNFVPIMRICQANIDSDWKIDYFMRGNVEKYLSH